MDTNNTELVLTNTLKVGDIIVVDGKPCRILKYTSAKPGKHGSSKTMFEAKDLITGKNVQTGAPTKGTMEIPQTIRETFTAIGLTHDDYLVLMHNGKIREDIRCPQDDNGKLIRSLIEKDKTAEVAIMFVLDHVLIQSVKESLD